MKVIDWIEIFVTTFFIGAIAWLFWAVLHAPDLTQQESDAHAAWLEARRKKRKVDEDLDDTESGVDK